MAQLGPPEAPPRVALDENDGARKYRLRLTQVAATLVTVLVTAWLCTLGVWPAIIGVVTAKHVLVAVYLMGVGIDGPRAQPREEAEAEPWQR
jgi:hypothetical protein